MARFFLPNVGFELGVRDWSTAPEWSIVNDAVNARSGAWVGQFVGNDIVRSVVLPSVAVRPGAIIDASIWIKDGTAGNAAVRVDWRDHESVLVSSAFGNLVAAGGGAYVQSTAVFTAPARAKFAVLGVRFSDDGGLVGGTWFVDDMDASGDIIESIPDSAIIRESRMITADTVGVFDPLVGEDKFSEFNSGMSDKWAGVYTFVPSLGGDLGELVAFIRRLGRTERFFAFDADRQTPLNGVVNGMVVDGITNGGNSRIPVRGGPINTTALVAGDYFEARSQYFILQRDLEIGPEGTGEAVVWPSVRASIADGEDVITDHPQLVARITSDLDWRRIEARPVDLTISWEEI